MKTYRLFAVLCLAAATPLGCNLRKSGNKELETSPAKYRQAQQLQDEIDRLNNQLAASSAENRELKQRIKSLEDKVNKLTFVNAQQARQIQDLSQAPVERDEYKKLAEDLKALMARQNKRLAELESATKLLRIHLKQATGTVPDILKEPVKFVEPKPEPDKKPIPVPPGPESVEPPPATQPARLKPRPKPVIEEIPEIEAEPKPAPKEQPGEMEW